MSTQNKTSARVGCGRLVRQRLKAAIRLDRRIERAANLRGLYNPGPEVTEHNERDRRLLAWFKAGYMSGLQSRSKPNIPVRDGEDRASHSPAT